jgi:hypothetical protein
VSAATRPVASMAPAPGDLQYEGWLRRRRAPGLFTIPRTSHKKDYTDQNLQRNPTLGRAGPAMVNASGPCHIGSVSLQLRAMYGLPRRRSNRPEPSSRSPPEPARIRADALRLVDYLVHHGGAEPTETKDLPGSAGLRPSIRLRGDFCRYDRRNTARPHRARAPSAPVPTRKRPRPATRRSSCPAPGDRGRTEPCWSSPRRPGRARTTCVRRCGGRAPN